MSGSELAEDLKRATELIAALPAVLAPDLFLHPDSRRHHEPRADARPCGCQG
jgi:hypothetical protein